MSKSLRNTLKIGAAAAGLAGVIANSSGCLGPMAMGVGATRGNAGLYAWGAGMSSIEAANAGRSQNNVYVQNQYPAQAGAVQARAPDQHFSPQGLNLCNSIDRNNFFGYRLNPEGVYGLREYPIIFGTDEQITLVSGADWRDKDSFEIEVVSKKGGNRVLSKKGKVAENGDLFIDNPHLIMARDKKALLTLVYPVEPGTFKPGNYIAKVAGSSVEFTVESR